MEYERELGQSINAVLKEAADLYETGGRLRLTYDRLVRRLSEMSIPCSLLGGYALILHGVRRFTEDIDLLVTAEGLRTLRERLLGRGYKPVTGSDHSIRDAETGVRIDFVVSGQFPGDGHSKPVAFPRPDQATQEIQGVQVVDLKTFIELKLASGMTASGRLQHLADVQRLIQTHCLTADYAAKLHPYVREKFVELMGK